MRNEISRRDIFFSKKSNQNLYLINNDNNNNRYSTHKENIVVSIYTYIHSNTYIHINIKEVKCFIVCYLIGEMDTQALFAAGTYNTLDIYEKCRAR